MPKVLKIHITPRGPYQRRLLNFLKPLCNAYVLNPIWGKENIRKREIRLRKRCIEPLPCPSEEVRGVSELWGSSLVSRLNTG